jgi:flagellar biosynthesis/type III secretory pathway chaperone
MGADTEQASLSAVLGEQVRCAEAMLETLARESAALADGNHDALEIATQAKTQLVDALERLESRRRQLSNEDDASGGDQWQRLRELIARCKAENQRNGTLLKARADNLRVALKALRGSEPELYSATGRTPSQADARPLGTA